MKLPGWTPRLNRGQKIVRNLLLTAAALAALWGVKGFPAPTVQLAARWAAAAYGLPEPEVLYVGDWYNHRRTAVLGWDGLMASAECVEGDLFFQRMYSSFHFVTPEEDAALLYTAEWVNPPHRNPMLYVWSDLPEAVRAEASLRLRTVVFTAANRGDGEFHGGSSHDWDETYLLTAAGNGHGIFPFEVPPKYAAPPEAESDGRPRQAHLRVGEEIVLNGLVSLRDGRGDTDFAAEIAVTFYDGAGNALQTWEKTMWPLPERSGDRGERRDCR